MQLIEAIQAHELLLGKEPELIMIRDTYKELHKFFFSSRLHMLCCGKGMLFGGIPAIITQSAMVETFLICY